MRLLSYPFRLTANGSIATVEQRSSQAAAEQIAMIVLTEKGERVMLPAFGIIDPSFDKLDAGEVALEVSLYGPKVTITNVEAYYQDDSTLTVDLEFTNGE